MLQDSGSLGKRKRRQKKAQALFLEDKISQLKDQNKETLKQGKVVPEKVVDPYLQLIKSLGGSATVQLKQIKDEERQIMLKAKKDALLESNSINQYLKQICSEKLQLGGAGDNFYERRVGKDEKPETIIGLVNKAGKAITRKM